MSVEDETGLAPISMALSASLHTLVVALTSVVLLNAASSDAGRTTVVVAIMIGFLATYAVGVWPTGAIPEPGHRGWYWLAALTLEWLALLWLSVEATYLVFALFFLYLRLMSTLWGTVVVAATTAVAVVVFGLHRGFSLPGLIGPVLGASVAITIAMGYQSLNQEVRRRQQLIEELTRTRSQLALAEHAAGVVEERGRLAREIHDTLSQSLSSIIMLLHAAQRSGRSSAIGDRRLEQAREAAEEALAETREFIHALAPPLLRTVGIAEALDRLARQTAEATGLLVNVTVPQDTGVLPTHVEAALLRIAQGALANVVQHAHATRADLTLTRLDDEIMLDVVDDGDGIEEAAPWTPHSRPTFGLTAMKERAALLGGTLVVESSRGVGTSVVASFAVNS